MRFDRTGVLMRDAAAPFSQYERMLARRYLFAKRSQGGVALITVISVIGIMLAVAVLISTMSIMNGFREELLSRILGVKGHIYIDVTNRPPQELATIIARARATPSVTNVAPLVQGQALAVVNGQASGAYVLGISKHDLEHIPIVARNLTAGSLANFTTDADGETGVLIGYRLAANLGIDRAGAPITLISPQGAATPFGVTPRRKTYLAAGLFKVDMDEYDSTLIYMPIDEAELFFSRAGPDMLELRVSNPDDTDSVMRALRANLGNDVFIYDWKAENQSMVDALGVERVMMALILMMIVAIAAMNIISGLVMLVKNKGRDIAILRTMGATRGAITRVFLMTGASIGVIGTLAGLALGTLFCIYIGPIQDFVSWLFNVNVFHAEVYSLSRIPAKVHWQEVAFVGGFALCMSFLWALIPSWWASRLDPVEALRYE